MMRRVAPIAVILLLALGACAPSVGSFATPFDLNARETARVSPGGTVYARADYRLRDFGYASGTFAGLYVPCGSQTTCLIVTREFDLVDVIAPEGWTWRVDRVDAVRRTGEAETFAVTLELDVPRDADLGGREIRARLRSRTGTTRDVSLIVQVVSAR